MIQAREVKELVNIIDVVESYGIRLNKGKACCPFHHEKTPSFSVSEKKQIFKCFGCGASGDVIEFVRRFTGMGMQDALKDINSRFGLGLSDEQPAEYSRVAMLKREEEKRKRQVFDEWKIYAYNVLRMYFRKLRSDIRLCEYDDERFVYAVHNIDRIEYMLDILIVGTDEEMIELYKSDKKEVDRIAASIGYRR